MINVGRSVMEEALSRYQPGERASRSSMVRNGVVYTLEEKDFQIEPFPLKVEGGKVALNLKMVEIEGEKGVSAIISYNRGNHSQMIPLDSRDTRAHYNKIAEALEKGNYRFTLSPGLNPRVSFPGIDSK